MREPSHIYSMLERRHYSITRPEKLLHTSRLHYASYLCSPQDQRAIKIHAHPILRIRPIPSAVDP